MREIPPSGSASDAGDVAVAKIEDIPRLSELLTILFTQEADFSPDAARQSAGLAAIIADSAVGHILVLRRHGEIIAMVNLLYTVSTALGERVAILEDMIVHPQHRACGAGSRLLRGAMEFARETGCRRITLLTDHDNSDAIRFYTAHGFTRSTMIPLRLAL